MTTLLRQLPTIIDTARAVADASHSAPSKLSPREIVRPHASDAAPTGTLIHADNLGALSALLPEHKGTVDFIYIDPPFASNADYATRIALPGRTIIRHAYTDTWPNGHADYLRMLTSRLILLRDLLADTGSIAVHIDWHVGHYVRAILDDLFGPDRFVNEVIWRYGKMSNASRRFPQNHDTIYVYSKSVIPYFMPILSSPSEYRARFERDLTQEQVLFGTVRNRRDKLITRRIAHRERELGRSLQDDDVLFDFTTERKAQDDVFTDISIIKGNARENLAYTTQKPEKLLERLITAFCPEGGTVLDAFTGAGTTPAVAERLGRNWLAIDLGTPAIEITRSRLIRQASRPFAILTDQADPVGPTLARPIPEGDHLCLTGWADFPLDDLELSPTDRSFVEDVIQRDPLALVANWSIDSGSTPLPETTVHATGRGSLPATPPAAILVTDVFSRRSTLIW